MGKVIAVLTSTSVMPGRSWTGPKPAICPSPTQPDQIATPAGSARNHIGHALTLRGVGVVACDWLVSGPSAFGFGAGGSVLRTASPNRCAATDKDSIAALP